MSKTIKRLIIIILILILMVIGSLALYFNSCLKPVSNISEKVNFTIESNTSSRQVLSNLKNEGIIKEDRLTYFYVRFFHPSSFKAGEYELDKSMSFNEIIDYLSSSKNAIQNTVTITFKEGEWLKHYASKLAEVTNVSYDELMNYWNDEEVLKGFMNEYPFLTEDIFNDEIRYPLEGYLFPDTYEFYRETSPEAITKRFLDHTLNIYNAYLNEFNNNSLSIHEIFTLASIVQYEANNYDDMTKVASVFYNRMEEGMPLQSSVTVCYAMDIEKGGDWRDCEYNPNYDSPYNTYMINGLTPGPILNPGEEAIKAVLNPAKTDYLYFMADVCNDGQVYYSSDYQTHQKYIDKYLTCY